ncbi:hypothetical protein HOV23_gp090 [Pseudomonas phage Lana]|uniref:Uncharacterized protein n=1 Tax=Pseudomonas phage Lana TaxID=2530172 RepID=A0A481W6A9_9CAUD|nr:hypothetical protein HOV23_gp090 [Pseudomonas phage Lana]QBJ04483.1 hypothetical protein [Pseudomonas phage Lana]
MPDYYVTLLANAVMFRQVTVTAENEEQAKAFATAGSPSDPSDWHIEPDTEIKDVEATEAVLEEEVGDG